MAEQKPIFSKLSNMVLENNEVLRESLWAFWEDRQKIYNEVGKIAEEKRLKWGDWTPETLPPESTKPIERVFGYPWGQYLADDKDELAISFEVRELLKGNIVVQTRKGKEGEWNVERISIKDRSLESVIDDFKVIIKKYKLF
jgi:hypothetical protein